MEQMDKEEMLNNCVLYLTMEHNLQAKNKKKLASIIDMMFSPELALMSNGKVGPDLWNVTSKVMMLLICESEHHVTRLAISGSEVREMDCTDDVEESYGVMMLPKASKEEVSECWGPQTCESLDAFRHLGKFNYTKQMMEMDHQMRAKEQRRETKESMEVDKLEEQVTQEQSSAAITGGGNKLKELRFNKLPKITESVYCKLPPPPQEEPEASTSSKVQAKTKGIKVPPQVEQFLSTEAERDSEESGSTDKAEEDGAYEGSFVDDHEELTVEGSSSSGESDEEEIEDGGSAGGEQCEEIQEFNDTPHRGRMQMEGLEEAPGDSDPDSKTSENSESEEEYPTSKSLLDAMKNAPILLLQEGWGILPECICQGESASARERVHLPGRECIC
ncbi:hypothetical protein EDC04DRAFT_2606009 [Pisolithus marmoratus]|nr:hypothetical protein EDC04DRAFT_2606009 [Pisolithus marmoratus]